MKLVGLLVLWLSCAGLAGCGARAQTAAGPLEVQARPVPLDSDRPDRDRVGALTYAGGLALTSQEPAFGGLSGFDVRPDGTFVSQTDAGELVTGRLKLDTRRHLVGLTETAISHLTDEAGEVYRRKAAADAEDITLLPNGGFAVAFEQEDRVQAYAGVGPPRRLGVPAEAANFSSNGGLEALAAWTDARGRPRLVQGAEDGRAWSCDPKGQDCTLLFEEPPEKDFSLTGLDALPGDRGLIAVYRAFDLIKGLRGLVVWVRPDAPEKLVVLARLVAPFTADNFEGVAALPNPDGSIRIYLVSDDNFSRIQRTLLLAFDWRR